VVRKLTGILVANFDSKREEMKTFATLALSLFLVSGMAFADSPKDADPSPAKSAPPGKSKPAAKKAEKTDASFAAELEELRQTLQSQQEQLQMLKEELGKRDRQIDEAREAAAAANARAAEASSRSFEAVEASSAVKATTESISSTVGDLKASNESLTSTVTTVAKDQAEAKKASEDGPASIKYKGITLTPGGFLAAETVFRNRADVADVNTALTGIPFNGSDLSKTTEFNFSGRQSRATLLAEGKLASWTLQGYYEADFLGAGVTSNNRQSNSYVFRQRQVFARAKSESGWGITGGQMWSLVTETKKLLDNRTEALPMTIDAQYTVGFSWARQYGLRFTKDFGSKFAAGFSIESPQTTIGGRGFPANFFTNSVGAGGGLYNFIDTAGYTVNQTPDFILKVAAEPGFGHYEFYGIISTFRERNYPCATTAAAAVCLGKTGPSANGAFNDTRTGGGIGANARVSLFNKKVDAGLHFLGGDGVGRYSTAQLADVTARADGTLAPIRGGSALGTLEFHFKKDDIYLNGGTEYAFRTAYLNSTGKVGIGYGSPLFNNTGCNVEALGAAGNGTAGSVPSGTLSPANAGACAGDIRSITEGTIGFWHRFYNGPKGRLQFGMQYSYVLKNTWSGNNAGATYGQAPNAHDNMLFTSFRYYIP
jgi:hypothetical protein